MFSLCLLVDLFVVVSTHYFIHLSGTRASGPASTGHCYGIRELSFGLVVAQSFLNLLDLSCIFNTKMGFFSWNICYGLGLEKRSPGVSSHVALNRSSFFYMRYGL